MELLTVILSAIAAIASVISVILVLKSNRDNRKHLQHRLDALEEEYYGPLGHMVDPTGRDRVRVEINSLKKDLKRK